MNFRIIIFFLTLSLTACTPQATSLTGYWTGVEGTALDIAATGDATTVTITDLDGPRNFPATQTRNGIAFTRDGQALTIRPGIGAGMVMRADIIEKALLSLPGPGRDNLIIFL